MPEPYSVSRKEDRFPFLKTIGYACDTDNTAALFKGITINISKSGMCMYMYESPCVAPNSKITIKSELPVNYRTGTIRWIARVDDGFYKAGLIFS
jgi:hypothetical protein